MFAVRQKTLKRWWSDALGNATSVDATEGETNKPRRSSRTGLRSREADAESVVGTVSQKRRPSPSPSQIRAGEDDAENDDGPEGDDGPARESKEQDADSDSSSELFSLRGIVDHRPLPHDANSFELKVQWLPVGSGDGDGDGAGFSETWEPEDIIQQDAPASVFAYWKSIPGGRTSQMADPDLWHVLCVSGHRRAKKRTRTGNMAKSKSGSSLELMVTWVGSRRLTWEPEHLLADAAPAALEEYWDEEGGRDKAVSALG